MDFLECVASQIQYLEDGGSPADYAAHDALKVLQDHWIAAIRDGAKPSDLACDLDTVVDTLRRIRCALM